MPFILKETIQLPDINSIGHLYEHKKTKAKVVYIQNDDKNKAFSISFATPVSSDNGIAHILEHSVLCGSKKYPTKEPFVELLKGSMSTFLNAMTFPDKTMYPVSSINNKDFNNLMDVYLDAVFYPLLLDNPLILAQEGWHYHLEKESDPLTYKGVVYNEMKGALSNPDELLSHETLKALLPDTMYAYEYGGHPLAIPTLTQEEFVTYHQTYYHPSNSYTFFYGDLNIDEQLNRLNVYFDPFEYKHIEQGPRIQKTPVQTSVAFQYSIDANEQTSNKTMISLNYVVGESKNMRQYIAYTMLADILTESNASPLKKAIQSANIAPDVESQYINELEQSVFSIQLKNSEKAHVETFKQIIQSTLNDLIENGIDEQLIQATINKHKFALKEATFTENGYSKGINYAINAMNSWLYNSSPFAYFQFEEIIQQIEQDSSVFKQLMTDLLNNQHHALVVGLPVQNLNEQQFTQVADQLTQYKQSLSQQALTHLVEQTQELLTRQNTPDSQEALQTLPLLELSDISEQVLDIPLNETEQDGVTYYHHEAFTSHISYVSFYSKLNHLSLEQLPYVQILALLLKNIDTQNYSLDALTNALGCYTGNVSFGTDVYVNSKNQHDLTPVFVIKGKAFSHNVEQMFQLITEILYRTDFSKKDRIKERLLECKSRTESDFFYYPHSIAISRLKTYFNKGAYIADEMKGLSFYHFVCDLLEHFDERYNDLVHTLQQLLHQVTNRLQLVVGFVGSTEDYQNNLASIQTFVQTFSSEPKEEKTLCVQPTVKNEGLILSQDVQYVAQGYNVQLNNRHYQSQWHVLRNILSYTYLWNRIRVQGGAYGAFNSISILGDFLFCTYRDPNIKQTLVAYQEAADFVKNLALNDRELTKAIIGTISTLDTPMSANKAGEMAILHKMVHWTKEDRQQERQAILSSSLSSLQTLWEDVASAMNENVYCVVGSQKALEEHAELFNAIVPIIV